MNAIDIGVIEAIRQHGSADEKSFAADFVLSTPEEREDMKERYVTTWMHYLAMSMNMETEDAE